MEPNHIFMPLSPNNSMEGRGKDSAALRACPLGPVPVIYYSTLLCLGLPANLLTVLVLSQLVSRRQKSSYIYLLALAAADVLVLLLVVFVDFLLEDFLLAMPFPGLIQKVVQILEFWALHTSVWVAVPLTVDRYVAVCHPLRYPSVSYPARTCRVIATVYVGCLLSAAPYVWWPDLWHDLSGDQISPAWKVSVGRNVSEGLGSKRSMVQYVLVWVHCLTVYAAPCSVFFALNVAIVKRLRSRAQNHSQGRLHLRGLATGRTTGILLAVTSVFAILWAPRTALLLYRLYEPLLEPAVSRSSQLLHLWIDVANMLALLNTGVNFFLYCFISKRFRAVAASALRAFPRWRPPPAPFYAGHTLSASSSPWISPANSQRVRMFVYQYDKHGRPVCISS
ncbi:probable G-protein coupled receptor 139 [Denticeps clupeoides]|uniref:G-protein coupled receptors family 1 profile domain-containing protein n=1 Tax=Denticeps clupeoides TaxID=299321 RepID=A0AAY4DR97_9TELE|nr:probable G-protein coupled receptor 139 [Denticeps clupeoides]